MCASHMVYLEVPDSLRIPMRTDGATDYMVFLRKAKQLPSHNAFSHCVEIFHKA